MIKMQKNRRSLPYYWSKTIDGKTYELRSEGHTMRLFEDGKEVQSWVFDMREEDEHIVGFGNVFVHHFDRWLKDERVKDYFNNNPKNLDKKKGEQL